MNLPPQTTLRLWLALSYSVFLYKNLAYKEEAIDVATEALQQAYECIDTLAEDRFNEVKSIITQLIDNLRIWNEKNLAEKVSKISEFTC